MYARRKYKNRLEREGGEGQEIKTLGPVPASLARWAALVVGQINTTLGPFPQTQPGILYMGYLIIAMQCQL
jgi:hypothetical protein